MGDTYKPKDQAYEAQRDAEISDAIRARRAARGAPNPAPATPRVSSPSIYDRIKAAITANHDAAGRPVGRGGQQRADAIQKAADEAATGRQRRGQSTDHQNGY